VGTTGTRGTSRHVPANVNFPTDGQRLVAYTGGKIATEPSSVLLRILGRRAAQVRVLVDRGVFSGLRVPLRNGGTLPAEMFAKVALEDLARLSALNHSDDGHVSGTPWHRLAKDIDLLHEVALARGYASTERDRVRA
jgi:hypothetical protein